MSKDSCEVEFWSGQLLELHTPDRDIYYTQLIHNKPNLLIQRPVNKKNLPITITDHMPITVYFHDDKLGLCTFNSTISLHQSNQTIIEKPSSDSIKKAQRRRFFRVQANIQTYLILAQENKSKEVEELAVLTHDISGGGISFLYPSKIFREGDFIKGSLHLKTSTDQQKISFDGRVVNVLKHESKFYKTSIEFIKMQESTRSEIIKFCIQKQIELRKKLSGEHH